MQIIPAIIGENFQEVKDKIEKVKGFVEWVQLDVVDGKFAEPESWGVRLGNNLHLWEPLDLPKIEMHLMVQRPEAMIDDWISTNVDRIIIHYESDGDKEKMIEKINKAGVQAGIALKFETPVEAVKPFLENIDVVQLMSIAQIGHYGESLDERVYDKIKELRQMSKDITIQIDGGVNEENAKKLIEAGANHLVIGSAIFKAADIKTTIENFQKL